MRLRFPLLYLRSVEHACEHCGAAVEDGVPFCPKCAAPQIRVRLAATDDDRPATPPLEPGTPGGVQPPAIPVPLSPYRPDWHRALRPALLWGLLATLLALFCSVYPPAFFVAAIFGFGFAGALTVRSALRGARLPLTGGAGARLGALAGLAGLVVFEILAVIAAPAMRGNADFRRLMEARLQSADPQARAFFLRIFDHPGQLIAFFMIAAFFYGLIFVVSAAVGGALSARRHSSR